MELPSTRPDHRTVRPVAIVPHTHWDREWYEPFQTFRLKLIRLIDGLLDLLEGDPSYRTFLLDGQLAVIDDYLEIRPENEGRLRALAAAGRLTVGPWYILMDEFLVSAETIVRNLQMGMARGASFGGVMEVGYLPDMFGHVAQMPQLLVAAGFEHAVVWRGVPGAIDTTAFVWEAPDGSQVRAEYLVAGYGNGAAIPNDAKRLVRRIGTLTEEFAPFLRGDASPLLVMNGTDHQRPQPWLGKVVAEANRMQDSSTLTITSLTDYLAPQGTEGLPTWTGELRSGARSNLLMGVGSNRIDVKQAAARAERALERMAEPLSALYLGASEWPSSFLQVAWTHMVRNAAHDSICACSVDEVVDAVLHRYAEARQIGEGLTDSALSTIALSLRHPGTSVVNPTARRRGGMVEVVTPIESTVSSDVQLLSERTNLAGTITLNGETVRNMLGLIQGSRIEDDAYITDVTLTEDDTGLDINIVIGPEPRDNVVVEEVKRELYTRLTARPDIEVRLTLDQPSVRRVLARQAPVDGFGWAGLAISELTHPVVAASGADAGFGLSNGLVTIVVDRSDGTFSIDGHPGYGRLVDSGDYGDTYNFSPPRHDTVVDVPDSVAVTILEGGPVRGTILVEATYTWPERVDDDTLGRIGTRSTVVVTRLELRAEEPTVRVHTAFDNQCRDHRLRVHLPLPEPAATSVAECAFATVERGLTAEGRPDEFGTPTFPSRRFVSAGGLTVVHEGLLEYELTDIGASEETPVASTLALTLLRSTGMLSRLGMSTRPLPAGPLLAMDGPQMVGPVEARYALSVARGDPYELADDVLVPLTTVASFGGGTRPAEGTPLTVTGAEVSSVRRSEGALEVRVFNPSGQPSEVSLPSRSGWLVDLRGRPLLPFEDSFELRAHGIATIRLD